MVFFEIATLLVFGGTGWLAQNRSLSRDRAHHDRLTVAALVVSAVLLVTVLAISVVALIRS